MASSQQMEQSFNNMFLGTCLEEIKREFNPILNDENYIKFYVKCLETLKNTYKPEFSNYNKFIDYVTKTYGIQPPVNNYAVEQYSRWYTQFLYLISIVKKFDQLEKEQNNRIDLIKQLQEFGLYNHYRVELINQLDIEKLKKELQEYKNSEKDAEKILNDEFHLNYLVSTHLGGYSNEDYKKYSKIAISESTKKLIQPEIDRRVMERKIDMEAKRRIARQQQLQKELEEKQKFEEAVERRMMEILKQNV
jgi:hypothetical protein